MGLELAGAMRARGFTELTPVQHAVLAGGLEGRDLRISSQTGSGKTVAIGLILRAELAGEVAPAEGPDARPRALVIVPTRELAKQVQEELSWLYAPLGARIASVAGGGGGAGYRTELRAFREGPAVIVGTPGRLLDHLDRGSIDPSGLAAVVLDEADRMLDMGFREDLESILAKAPEARRTHLVSATFPREVLRLADRVQREPARIEGTPLGHANADIAHVIHVVANGQQVSGIVNLLLAHEGQALIFARTRADVADLASALRDAGFACGMLSGDMEQPERNRALAAFKRGHLTALVATDVAARGIDVQDVACVIHAEPPNDADSYTHRSGRTGRAGRKGTSAVVVTPAGARRAAQLLTRAGVSFEVAKVPSADDLRRARDERVFTSLTSELPTDADADPSVRALADRIAGSPEPARAIARLLAAVRSARGVEPRELTDVDLPKPRTPSREALGPAGKAERPRDEPGAFVPFRVSWGQVHGANTRRVLAVVCRRGEIQGSDVGAIRIARTYSVVDVAAAKAAAFEAAAAVTDPRNPKVQIRPYEGTPPDARRPAPRSPRERDGAPPRYRSFDDAPRPERDGDAPRPRRDDAPRYKSFDDARRPKGDDAPRPSGEDAPRPKRDDDAPRFKRFDDAPRPKRDGDAPRFKRFDDAPRPKRDGDAPRPRRDGDAPRPRRDGDAPRPRRDDAPRPSRDDAPRPKRDEAPRPSRGGFDRRKRG